MVGKILVNTDAGREVLAKRQLRPAKIDNFVAQLEAFIGLESPTAAEKLSQQKLQARILKRLLNNLR